MPIAINGTGTITGISAGGLPDDCITTAEIAGSAVTTAKVNAGSITAAKLDGAQTGSAPIYGVRAWCVFNGTTAGTNAPIAGGNIASITRNSVGDYAVTFTTPMPSANYCVTIGASTNGTGAGWIAYPHIFTVTAGGNSTPTASSFRFVVTNYQTTGYIDCTYLTIMVVA